MMNSALQEGLQITNNCIINTCKQPFGSWLINFHGPFYLHVCRGRRAGELGCRRPAVDQCSPLCPARDLGVILTLTPIFFHAPAPPLPPKLGRRPRIRDACGTLNIAEA